MLWSSPGISRLFRRFGFLSRDRGHAKQLLGLRSFNQIFPSTPRSMRCVRGYFGQLVVRFQSSNPIKQPFRACRTKCGRRDFD
jgi:hypothetical protein